MAGYYRVEKTLELLRRSWYWENMKGNICNYYRECNICQKVKAKRHLPYSLLSSLLQPERPWSEISIDFITGLPPYKNPAGGPDFNTILIVINRYSKMAKYITYYKTVNSPELTKIIWKYVFSIFGSPNRIISD
jgi:hypothetical protein